MKTAREVIALAATCARPGSGGNIDANLRAMPNHVLQRTPANGRR